MTMEKSSLQMPQFDYVRYLKLLWKKKVIIIGISSIIFMVWFVVIYKFMQPSLPVLPSTVTLVFDDPRTFSAVNENVGLGGESRLGLIKSRNFLERIVEKQSLRLQVNNAYRSQFFDTIEVDTSVKIGIYKFHVDDENYSVLFSNNEQKIENKKITTGSLKDSESLALSGISAIFNKNYLNKPYDFTFEILRTRTAIDRILNNLDFKLLDQRGTLFGLVLKGTDHPLITKVVNKIADEFIEQNLNFKKRKTTEVISVLEKQLESAKEQLTVSQNELKKFQQIYPWVGLKADVMNSVNEVSNLESSVNDNQQTLGKLKELQARFTTYSGEDQALLLNEMLSYLNAHGMTTVSAMQNELSQLLSEKNKMEGNYSDQHPLVVINKEKINRLSAKIYSAVTDLISQLENSIQDDQASRDKLVGRLRSLPAKEQQLAELRRSDEINSKIYSTILVRYNEAKIADAVEVGDIYVLDYAVVPFVNDSIMDFIRKFVLGIFIALGVSVGGVIILDYFDKSIKNPKDIKTRLDIPVLATFPIIGELKGVPNHITAEKKLDEKLITSDYAPNIASEAFRTLRTKLILNNHQTNKSILIASLNPGEGKSLVSSNLAITFAQQKLPTLLVDCDLRRGVLHNSFACEKKPGLADFLAGNTPVSIENLSDIIQNTHVPNLFIISGGIQVPNPSELLAGERLKSMIATLRANFSILIIDTPPIEFIPDAIVLSTLIDQIVLVTRYGKTNLDKLSAKVHEFASFKEKLAGIIINASPEIVLKKYVGYSYYQY